eukprot:scaffold45668_cov45-Attheya_sp.AAC.2
MTQTDSSDTQSPPTTPTSQPMTQAQASTTLQPPTMHFEAAVPTLTYKEQISAILIQMASITTLLESIKTDYDNKREKYKRDLSNQLKDDVTISTAEMETSVDTIDAKVADVESDMQRHNLDIDNLEALQTEVTPKIHQAITRPASLDTSLDARNDSFPRFQATWELVLPYRSRFHLANTTTLFSQLLEPVVALPTPASPPTENMDFPRFSFYMGTPTNLQPTVSPADFSNHNIVCISADDDSTGLPPEQGLFPFANHTISDVGSVMKNLKDLPACGDDRPLLDRFFDFLGVLRFAPKDFFSILDKPVVCNIITSSDTSSKLRTLTGVKIANLQQENLLQDIKKDLEEIKSQLLTINRSLEEKNQERKRDKENKVSSAEQRFIDAQKEEYSVTLDHRQARRIAREWSKKRTLETNEKKRKAVLDSINNYSVSFGSYNIDRLRNSGEGFDSTSEDESRDGRHSDQITKKKNEVALFYGGDAEVMIRTVREFDEVADDLEFTEAHEKFTNFRKCLRDVARDDWDTAKVGQDMTIAGFKATMYILGN